MCVCVCVSVTHSVQALDIGPLRGHRPDLLPPKSPRLCRMSARLALRGRSCLCCFLCLCLCCCYPRCQCLMPQNRVLRRSASISPYNSVSLHWLLQSKLTPTSQSQSPSSMTMTIFPIPAASAAACASIVCPLTSDYVGSMRSTLALTHHSLCECVCVCLCAAATATAAATAMVCWKLAD